MNKSLVLFTVDYPFGVSESGFLKEELIELSRKFKNVTIVPLRFQNNTPLTELPDNAIILKLNAPESKKEIRDIFFFLKCFLLEFFQTRRIKLLANIRYHFNEFIRYIDLAKVINDKINEGSMEEDSLYYTYWFDEWTSALSILRYKFGRNIKIVTRAHGYDLYEERNAKGYIFLRRFQLKSVTKVFAVSENGCSYLQKAYPNFHRKFAFSRLGIHNSFDGNSASKHEGDKKITLVSCSQIIPVKRVHKIAEVLSHCKNPIRWIHFGDGFLREDLATLIKKLPVNISVEMPGAVKNEIVLEFYQKNHVDWFINVSESEGIPVSIMEAISFGIPVIAPNVGGISEIVNKITGVLIVKDFEAKNIAEIIESKIFDKKDRNNIIDFWNRSYNSAVNYKKFSNEIFEINNTSLNAV